MHEGILCGNEGLENHGFAEDVCPHSSPDNKLKPEQLEKQMTKIGLLSEPF